MVIQIEQKRRDVLVLRVIGKLRGSAALRLGRAMEAFLSHGVDKILFDLRSCQSLDTLGVGTIRELVLRSLRVAFLDNGLGLREDFQRGGMDLAREATFTDERIAVGHLYAADEPIEALAVA